MKRFSLSQEEYEQIRRAERRTRDKNVSRRLRVLMLRYEGRALSEIAAEMGMQINSISQMCRRYREQGLEEFMRNKYTSHRYALPKEKENELLALFEKRIREGGEVSAAEIKAAFDEARGKDTGRGYIYMLLKRHGWKALRKKAKPGKAGEKSPKTGNQVFWAPARTGTKYSSDPLELFHSPSNLPGGLEGRSPSNFIPQDRLCRSEEKNREGQLAARE